MQFAKMKMKGVRGEERCRMRDAETRDAEREMQNERCRNERCRTSHAAMQEDKLIVFSKGQTPKATGEVMAHRGGTFKGTS